MINWISINNKPSESKEYLVEYHEYFGIEYIKGYKIIQWDNDFKLEQRQKAYRYAEVPEHIQLLRQQIS